MAFKASFRRKEVKFLLTAEQAAQLLTRIADRIEPDAYPHSAISNLYYDTPDFRLIRRSLQKPDFKEKLRLRCYSTPTDGSDAFLEIKRKVEGIVYKRRACLPYGEAEESLRCGTILHDGQVFREIEWMYRLYPGLAPAMMIAYERDSFRGLEDPELRLTVDREIRWRTQQLDLSAGTCGEALLPAEMRLLEVKIPGVMPLWLAQAMSACGIRRTSFSKYGRAYETMLRQNETMEVEKYA
ncbi:MAG: polyphosphate polymerase domain-containing protein [Oscillospiraceae bacterium]|nr:polyphosphate polymerase domain-containing protein [Oscillospiraceae bacterium]